MEVWSTAAFLTMQEIVSASHRPHIDRLFSGLSHWLSKLPAAPTARSDTVDGRHTGCTSTQLGRRGAAQEHRFLREAAAHPDARTRRSSNGAGDPAQQRQHADDDGDPHKVVGAHRLRRRAHVSGSARVPACNKAQSHNTQGSRRGGRSPGRRAHPVGAAAQVEVLVLQPLLELLRARGSIACTPSSQVCLTLHPQQGSHPPAAAWTPAAARQPPRADHAQPGRQAAPRAARGRQHCSRRVSQA